jgi:hypothetical protein
MEAAENKKVLLPGVPDSGIFKIGTTDYIKFPSVNSQTPIVARDILFTSTFGTDNDFRNSKILKKLQEEYLPEVIEAVGAENVCSFKTDLTTLDGLKPYEDLESRVSLPTFDFYRANVKTFDRYPVGEWWWLATPDTAQPHYDPIWGVCVSPSGSVISDYYFNRSGVRPFYILNSSIFGSCEECHE